MKAVKLVLKHIVYFFDEQAKNLSPILFGLLIISTSLVVKQFEVIEKQKSVLVQSIKINEKAIQQNVKLVILNQRLYNECKYEKKWRGVVVEKAAKNGILAPPPPPVVK